MRLRAYISRHESPNRKYIISKNLHIIITPISQKRDDDILWVIFPKYVASAHTQIDWIVALRESDDSIGTNFAKTTTTRSVVQIADSLSRDGRKHRKTEEKIFQLLVTTMATLYGERLRSEIPYLQTYSLNTTTWSFSIRE